MAGAGLSTVSAHRRSLVTATAAGAVLCALWFVPTARATPDHPGSASHAARSAAVSAGTRGAHAADRTPAAAAVPVMDTERGTDSLARSPYTLGAIGVVGGGGALVIRARRHAREGESGF